MNAPQTSDTGRNCQAFQTSPSGERCQCVRPAPHTGRHEDDYGDRWTDATPQQLADALGRAGFPVLGRGRWHIRYGWPEHLAGRNSLVIPLDVEMEGDAANFASAIRDLEDAIEAGWSARKALDGIGEKPEPPFVPKIAW